MCKIGIILMYFVFCYRAIGVMKNTGNGLLQTVPGVFN